MISILLVNKKTFSYTKPIKKILYKFLHRYSTYSTSAIFFNKWILIFWGKLTREGKGKTFKLWKSNKKKQNK